MAVTKILSIKERVDNRVKYICKSEKTNGKTLISSYSCDGDCADMDFALTAAVAKFSPYTTNSHHNNEILAYHLIQSFSPNDNITPEEAHRIGRQLADKLLGGRYEYVCDSFVTEKVTRKLKNLTKISSINNLEN